MRLPAITLNQIHIEDARAFHESLWSAYLGQAEPVIVPIGTRSAGFVMQRISGNHKNYWSRRGYRLRQGQTDDRKGVRVWLEAVTPDLG